MEKKEPTLLQNILFLVYVFASMFLTAVIFKDLSNWFVIPLLNVAPITYWQMLGVAIFVDAIQVSFTKTQEKTKPMSKVIYDSIAIKVLLLLFWGFGALIALAL